MNDKKQLVEGTMTIIKQISDLFYQQKSHEAFTIFASFLDPLTKLSEHLFAWKKDGSIAEFDDAAYLNTLVQAMNALEAKDEVLLADILNYDLIDQLQIINDQL